MTTMWWSGWIQLLWLWYCAWYWKCGYACSDTLWFQTSVTNVSTLLTAKANYRHLPRENVQSASDCAQLCYTTASCKSAVFTPQTFEVLDRKKRSDRGGMCTLLPLAPECNDADVLISQISSHSSTPVLMYCFSCSRILTSPKKTTTTTTTDEEREEDGPTSSTFEIHVDGIARGNETATAYDGVINNFDEKTGSRTRKKRSRVFSLRVMTFNTWLSGHMVEQGLDKISKHILTNEPDIVFLQEMTNFYINGLLTRLGKKQWRACSRNTGQFNHIITRHKVVAEYEPAPVFWNNGCQVQMYPPDEEFIINLWNVHLYQHNYGPYKACSKKSPIKSSDELHNCEFNPKEEERCRMRDIFTLARHEPFIELSRQAGSGGPPLIVAGDFNAPSHLDWTESARRHHCDFSYEWPVSSFMAKMGFIDSYRMAQLDPVWNPGTTWSTIYKDSTTEFVDGRAEPEPQDRIDFIYYKGDKLQVLDSYVYSGLESIRRYPNHKQNDWPSDHASVISNFAWTGA